MTYTASLNLTSRLTTAFAAALFAGIIFLNLFVFEAPEPWVHAVHYGISALLVAIFLFCYLFRVTGYEVTGEELTIRRPIGNHTILIAEITDVIIPTRESIRWSLRTFGNGGVFGYYGKFANATYGHMTWYATRTDRAVVLVTRDKSKILITPDDQQLVEELRKYNRVDREQ